MQTTAYADCRYEDWGDYYQVTAYRDGVPTDIGTVFKAIEDDELPYRSGPDADAEAIARLWCAAWAMRDALELVLAYLTNVNVTNPMKLASVVVAALDKAGTDRTSLDSAATAMLAGAARLGGR